MSNRIQYHCIYCPRRCPLRTAYSQNSKKINKKVRRPQTPLLPLVLAVTWGVILYSKGVIAKGFLCLGPSSEVPSLIWSTVNKKIFIEESVFDLLILLSLEPNPARCLLGIISTAPSRPVNTSWDPCSPDCQLRKGSPSPHRLGLSWHVGHKFPQSATYLLGFNIHFTVLKSSVLFSKYISVTAALFQVSLFLLTKPVWLSSLAPYQICHCFSSTEIWKPCQSRLSSAGNLCPWLIRLGIKVGLTSVSCSFVTKPDKSLKVW